MSRPHGTSKTDTSYQKRQAQKERDRKAKAREKKKSTEPLNPALKAGAGLLSDPAIMNGRKKHHNTVAAARSNAKLPQVRLVNPHNQLFLHTSGDGWTADKMYAWRGTEDQYSALITKRPEYKTLATSTVDPSDVPKQPYIRIF